MRKLSYLTVPVVCLALIALSCGQVAPTAQSEVAQQQEDDIVLPQSAEVPIIPGNCCPVAFHRFCAQGHPADLNGDGYVCRKITPQNTIIIDNIIPGDCGGCIPPCC